MAILVDDRPAEPRPLARSRDHEAVREDREPAANKKRRKRKSKSGWSISSISVHPEIITGLLMMLGAAVWFFVGLAAGRIFFYPPILFVLGIGAVIRGFTGRD